MAFRSSTLDATLDALDQQLAGLPDRGGAVAVAIGRFRADAGSLRFHLRDRGDRPPIVAILGGTGTGKSTILNRLVRQDLSAANFRRTFTAGAIAVPWRRVNVPRDWLGVQQATLDAEHLPRAARPTGCSSSPSIQK
jgi:hypothetical protein